jgi:hypothetical protein
MKPALTEKIQLGKQSASMQNSIYVTSSRLVTKFSTNEENCRYQKQFPCNFVASLDMRYGDKAV